MEMIKLQLAVAVNSSGAVPLPWVKDSTKLGRSVAQLVNDDNFYILISEFKTLVVESYDGRVLSASKIIQLADQILGLDECCAAGKSEPLHRTRRGLHS